MRIFQQHGTPLPATSYLLIRFLVLLEILQPQSLRPVFLGQVEQHQLLQLVLPIVDRNRIIMPIQAVYQSLNGGLLQVA